METKSTLVIFALIAALGLMAVVAVDVMLTAQEVEAKGCRTSQAVNASKGRCIKAELTAENEEIQQEEDAEPSNEEVTAEEEKEIETDEEIQEESEEE